LSPLYALLAALSLMVFASPLACANLIKTPTASCHYCPLSDALLAALKLMVSDFTLACASLIGKPSASYHSCPLWTHLSCSAACLGASMMRHGFEPKWLRQLFLGLEGPFLAFMPRWQPNCLTETVDKCPLHLFDRIYPKAKACASKRV
jgi:hypothetical protein